ncbi:MAG: ATP-binding protein [Agriterribacter sp.]
MCSGLWVDSWIADMVYDKGRYRLAIDYYKRLFEQEKSCPATKKTIFQNGQRYLDNIGLCYTEIGMPDSAMFYYNATLNYLKDFEEAIPAERNYIELARAVVYGNIGRVKAAQKDFETAETLSLASIKGTAKEDLIFTLTTKLQLANYYVAWDKLDRAEKLLHEIDSTFNANDNKIAAEKRMEWNLAMRKLWRKKGNSSNAYFYGDQYLRISDSLALVAANNVSRDFGKELEAMEQRSINESLTLVNKQKSFQLAIAVLASALAVVIILFVMQNLRRSSKHVKELEKMNVKVQEKNDDLMEAYKSLEESHAENNRMTRMVAHDLKNPIGGIRTLVYSLMSKKQPEELQKILELVYSTCTNSINTINDLLTDKGSFAAVKQEMVDLRRLMEYCVDLLRTKSDEKKQELHIESAENIHIKANREKMWRVMSNLISNAIKFSPEHSTIDIMLARRGRAALLTVKDRGIGIPEHLHDKIFASAPEASRTGTSGEESHGLGLSISKQIVTEHNGKIWFESEERKGSTFYVELPLS